MGFDEAHERDPRERCDVVVRGVLIEGGHDGRAFTIFNYVPLGHVHVHFSPQRVRTRKRNELAIS